MPTTETPLRIWRVCGGPMDEVSILVDVLVGADLVVADRGHYRLSRAGVRVRGLQGTDAVRAIALALIRAGFFSDQARELLDLGTSEADGALVCPLHSARRSCPQLTGLLRYWPDVSVAAVFRIPAYLAREIEAVWALLPAPVLGENNLDALRKNVGNRGELYSYQLERLQAESASDVVWVARDDENLGYDIEDRSCVPYRRVEVKASGGSTVRFFVSENEWNRAHNDPEPYEIHFWGGVDLGVDPAVEFQLLRARGYPIVLPDLASQLAGGHLDAVPCKWRVTLPLGGREERLDKR